MILKRGSFSVRQRHEQPYIDECWGRERGAETGNRGGEIDEREAEGAQKQRR